MPVAPPRVAPAAENPGKGPPAPASCRQAAWFRPGPALAALLAACLGIGSGADAATVATLDGQEIHGDTITFSGDTVTINGTKLALADCDWLSLGEDGANAATQAAPTGDADTPSDGVTLIDGSWMPVTSVGAAPMGSTGTAHGEGPVSAPVGVSAAADGRLTIACKDLELGVLLRWISSRAGTVIVCLAKNPPKVTLQLENATWQDAVQAIADQYGFIVDRKNIDWTLLPSSQPGTATTPASVPPAQSDETTASATTSCIPDAIAIDGPLGPLVLPLATVAGWGEFPATAPPADDHDQVLLAAGPLSGRVLGITPAGTLSFASAIDPKPLEFPVARVAALRMSLQLRVPAGILLAAALDAAHPPLMVLPRPGLPLAAAPGVATGNGLANIRLSVEGGRRVYLGSLVPATVSEEGAFGTVWPHTVDHDLDGGPLILRGVRHAHGMVIHSKATLTWNLGGAYLHFHALLGITDAVAPEGDCALTISGDGKALFARDSIKGTDPALPLDLDVKGVKTLEIKVDYGARYDIGDHLGFADAFLLKK